MKPKSMVALAAALLSVGVAAQDNPMDVGAEPRLDSVTIIGTTGDIDRVTGSAQRIEREALEQYRYDDIHRVLNRVPGVYLREEDGYGLRPNIGMRGASADRSQKVTLMEDGVLLAPAPYSAPAAYFFPLMARMSGVEVYKGAASIQHGPQTIGGAVNLLTTPIPQSGAAFLEAATGSDEYWRLHARGAQLWGELGLMGEFVHADSGGFKRLDGGGDTGFSKNELLLKGMYPIGSGQLEWRIGYADEVSDETYLGLTEADFRADALRRYRASSLDRMEWDWRGGRVNWNQALLGGSLQLTGYLHSFDRRWRKFNNFSGADIRDVLANPGTPFNQLFVGVLRGANTDGTAGTQDDLRIGTNARDFISSGVQGRMSWEVSGDLRQHLIEAGLRLHHDRIRRLHDEFGFEQLNGQVVQNAQPRAITTDNRASTEAVAFWLRDEIRQGRWTLAPGLRVENISAEFVNHANAQRQRNDYSVVLPGLGASYELFEHFKLLGGVHRGFSPAAPSLSGEIEPERALNYEAGARWSGTAGRFELIGFYNDYSNLTSICTVSSGCSPVNFDTQTNAGKAAIAGVEAGWDRRFELTPELGLPLAFNYTWTEAEFREAFSSGDPQFGNVQPGFELPYVPRHRAHANLGVAAQQWGVNLSATHTSRMRDQAGRGAFDAAQGSDAVTVLDLAAHWNLASRLMLNGRVDNLLDEEYVVSRRPYGARPGKPLGVQLGLAYRY